MKQHSAAFFGTTPRGEAVYSVTLDNGALSCEVLTYGAVVRRLLVPDRQGRPVDVVLGYDTLQTYLERDKYFGAVVGRFANRIAKGRFTLHGNVYTLPVNNGENHHHGGPDGFAQRVWTIETLSETSVTLSLHSPDGDQGYPGNLTAKVTYALEGTGLFLRYEAVSDADTVCSLTNHSYFNLSGHNSGTVLDQFVTVHASAYTPADSGMLPLGILAPVEGTPMDLRQPVRIGRWVDDSFAQLQQAGGYDHNYVPDGQIGSLRPAAEAYSEATGIAMEVLTDRPGVHFYTANFVEPGHTGKDGAIYGPRHGFCMETQHFPDSPNQPAFPSPVLPAGQLCRHETAFIFSTMEETSP